MELSEQTKERKSTDDYGAQSVLSMDLIDISAEAPGTDTAPEKDDVSSESDVEEAEETANLSVRRRTQNSKFKDL